MDWRGCTWRVSRRDFLKGLGGGLVATEADGADAVRVQTVRGKDAPDSPFFLTRGVVLVIQDLRTLDWPERARRAGLTTLATHIFPHEVAAFIQSEAGQTFLRRCGELGLHVEHELHAMSDLLPRQLFEQDPTMFPMNEKGDRVREYNLCVHSQAAVQVACENAAKYTRILRSTTGRYFYWIDDGRPMCRCPKCRGLSDSDQALLLENRLLEAIRQVDSQARVAHLAYARTLEPPKQVRPADGIFLEFAPIERRYDVPLSRRDAQSLGGLTHGRLLDALDANLAWFGSEGAQVLEYWLDVSRFAGWKRQNVRPVPWNDEVFGEDLATYGRRRIRHITTFAAWIDGEYVRRFGDPPVERYGASLQGYAARDM